MKNNNNHIRYYTYLRKSSEGEDRQVQSIERQAEEVQKLITYQGLNIVGTFQESRSAMTPNNRPEFAKMIKGIKAGKANGIICWHMNRLARNPLESGIVQQLLEDRKIQSIITKDREYTPSDNAIIFSVESSLATQYSKDLGKMVKSGMEKKALMGISPNSAPLGYLNTKLAEHGSNYIIKDPERFEVVRKIWDMMLSGVYVPSQILTIIKKETGLTPRLTKKSKSRELTLSGLYDLLTNCFYTGLFMYNNKTYEGKHEAMITIDEFEKVQQLLGRKGNPRYQKHQFTYRGIFYCAECGCAITATEKTKLIKSTGLYKSYIYYYCTNRKANINCQSRIPIRVEEFEEQIKSEIASISISETFQKLAIAVFEETGGDMRKQQEVIQASLQKAIKGIEKELKNLLQLRIAGTITDEEYKQEKENREKRILYLKQKQKEFYSSPFIAIATINERLISLTNILERFEKATEEGRKKILLTIGENYQVIGKKLSITKPFWLQATQKHKKGIEAEISWLELQEYVDIKAFSNQFMDMFPLMCALVKEVGTEQNTNNSKPPCLT